MCSKSNDDSTGLIVWARTNKRYWPGLRINHMYVNFKEPKRNNSLIFWFGDYRISEISNSNILNFPDNFLNIFDGHRKRMGKSWMTGVLEAIHEFGLPHTEGFDEDQLLHWAKENVPEKQPVFSGLSAFVRSKLYIICNANNDNIDYSKKTAEHDVAVLLSKNKDGVPLKICLGCYSNDVADKHPLFDGFICHACKGKFKRSYFATGYDGIKYFCVVCACSGDLILCERIGCNLVYCYKCIDDLAKPGAREEILTIDGWHCFACDEKSKFNGFLHFRKDWRQNILNLYDCGNYILPEIQHQRPLRVLSLFDGIATGLTALVNLNIPIEAYFSSEIDTSSMSVVKKHFPSGVTFLGDIKKLSDADIKGILPIDLLLGGSPCNDLSLVNPARKGLYEARGTGILFFDYYRILKTIQTYNNHRLYWLFENVASMSHVTKQSMTRFLECEPVLIDAACVSSMHRPRLFWGNLPSLQCQSFAESGHSLQDDLLPGRKALVEKLQTVTTNRNSLRQGPKKKLPVLSSEGMQDNVDIRELERIYGFPNNFTKTGKLSSTSRQALLGKAWSVKVIMIILHCLKEIC